VTYQQDQEYQARDGVPATDDEYQEMPGDVEAARPEPEEDDEDMALEPDVIVAEVIDEDPQPVVDENPQPVVGENPQPVIGENPQPVIGEDPQPAGLPADSGQMSQRWHDIQAGFVDDPQGAVKLAAQAADDALTTLVAALRERQMALGSAGATEDTEILRGALREYRQFCAGIEEVGRGLPQPISGS
jgi:hypothetical protein